MITHIPTIFIVGLLNFPTQTLADARDLAETVVDCLNEKSTLNRELRIFETHGPIARILEPDDHRNSCTAQHYFCVVSAEVNWMLTWNIILKVESEELFAYDLFPKLIATDYRYSHVPFNVPVEVAAAVSECGVK